MSGRNNVLPILLVMAIIMLCACTHSYEESSDDAIQGDRDQPIGDMQLEIPYGNSTAHLDGLWPIEVESDFEYRLYVAADIDLTGLSEKDYHFWGEDFECSLYLDGGKNEVDFEDAAILDQGVVDGHHIIIFVYPSPYAMDPDDNRESYLGTNVVFAARPDKDDPSADYTVQGNIDEFTWEAEFIHHVEGLGYSSL